MKENRCALARQRSGLSIGQAAKKLGGDREFVETVESMTVDELEKSNIDARVFAELYGCSVEWMLGKLPQHDFARLDAISGSENLTPNDRKAVAELLASIPKQTETVAERLARIMAQNAASSSMREAAKEEEKRDAMGYCDGCQRYSMRLVAVGDRLLCGGCRGL